jgi:hypothetical protein
MWENEGYYGGISSRHGALALPHYSAKQFD